MVKQEKYLGEIKEGTSTKVVFPLPHKLEIVKDPKGKRKIVKSCSCVSLIFSPTELKVMYRPADIPKHLVGQGYYFTTKTITIYHLVDNREKELVFKFTAKIIRK